MKKFLFAAALTALSAPIASAQGEYTLAVESNGVSYNCVPNIEVIDGVRSRRCVRAGADGGSLFSGGGIGGAAIPIIVVAVAALAIGAGGDDDGSTVGTN